jgi:hypothetical protein
VIEVNEGVAGPEAMLKLLARDHLSAVFEKDGENLARLLLELDANAMLAELTGPHVEVVRAEAQRGRRESGMIHRLE